MPKFIDSSHVKKDVMNLKKDVEEFHAKYFQKNYTNGKHIFLSKEASNYEILSKHLPPPVFEKYKELVSKKQFYIRETIDKLESYEQMLDRMTEQKNKDADALKKFVEDNNLTETLMGHLDVNAETYLSNELNDIRQVYIDFVEDMSKKYEKLYSNFAVIFLKVLQQTMDIGILTMYLDKIRDIENNRTTQEKASIEIGQKMFDKYVKK